MKNKSLEISYVDYLNLKAEYKKVMQAGVKIFVFKDQQLVTAFAKYLLEYLSSFFVGADMIAEINLQAINN